MEHLQIPITMASLPRSIRGRLGIWEHTARVLLLLLRLGASKVETGATTRYDKLRKKSDCSEPAQIAQLLSVSTAKVHTVHTRKHLSCAELTKNLAWDNIKLGGGSKLP
eukprot:SAG31_NODE_2346_length_5902_cov_23.293814_4_plen_109_part_00